MFEKGCCLKLIVLVKRKGVVVLNVEKSWDVKRMPVEGGGGEQIQR